MKLTRRQAIRLMGSVGPAMAVQGQLSRIVAQSSDGSNQQDSSGSIAVTAGRFLGTRASLKAYTTPDWFADAKFGIWSHWGPQSAVGDGDWYARNMYIQGSPQNLYHVQRFGPPSKVGYKDLIHL